MVVLSRSTAGAPGTLTGMLGWCVGSPLLLAAVACGPSHPATLDPNEPVEHGGEAGNPKPGPGEAGAGSGASGGSGGSGGSTTIPDKVPRDIFDPGQVYLIAAASDHKYAIAPAEDPASFILGLDSFGTMSMLHGELYFHSGSARPLVSFAPDITVSPQLYAADLADFTFSENDPVINTAPCVGNAKLGAMSGPSAFFTSPDDRLIYRCPDDANKWYESGKQLFVTKGDLQIIAFGSNGLLLTANPDLGVMHIGDDLPINFPGGESGYIARAVGDGFHVGIFNPLTTALGVLEVQPDGSSSLYGKFEETSVQLGSVNAMSADDSLYTVVFTPEPAILRRTISGAVDIIFTAGPGTVLEGLTPSSIQSVAFFTGP